MSVIFTGQSAPTLSFVHFDVKATKSGMGLADESTAKPRREKMVVRMVLKDLDKFNLLSGWQ